MITRARIPIGAVSGGTQQASLGRQKWQGDDAKGVDMDQWLKAYAFFLRG